MTGVEARQCCCHHRRGPCTCTMSAAPPGKSSAALVTGAHRGTRYHLHCFCQRPRAATPPGPSTSSPLPDTPWRERSRDASGGNVVLRLLPSELLCVPHVLSVLSVWVMECVNLFMLFWLGGGVWVVIIRGLDKVVSLFIWGVAINLGSKMFTYRNLVRDEWDILMCNVEWEECERRL